MTLSGSTSHRRRAWRVGVITLMAALALAGCEDDPKAAAPAQPAGAETSRIVLVLMENKEYGDVIGSGDAPYVNRLAREYSAPRHLYGIRHPSLPNYIALIAGSTLGIDTNCTRCIRRGRTLVDQLERADVSWRAYLEGMPRACYRGKQRGRYVKRHNPFVYFRSILRRPSRCAKVVPQTRLAPDIEADRLPEFVFVKPDLCNDTHDCSVRHGDRYLSRLLPPLIDELGPRGFLLLAWEEGESDASCCGGLARGGRVPVVIAGLQVRRGSRPRTRWSHYSTLRTIEDAFGLRHLRNAAAPSTRPLDAAFERPPRLR
jgi:hypothetical protein